MVRKKSRKKFFTILAALIVLVTIVAVVVIVNSQSASKPSDTSQTPKKDEPAVPDQADNTNKAPETNPGQTPDASTIDPAKVTTIDIAPMSIIVSYMKGVGGFDFEVLRTSGGTKYVQFSSPKLVGTKCTNDEGVFASIIEAPTADEAATLAKTTTVDGTTYGLSLADATCTPDAGLLKQYQDAFSEPFSLLKKM